MDKTDVIKEITVSLQNGDKEGAKSLILSQYPFDAKEINNRNYTIKQRMDQFVRDGFIDRYSGQRLVNPGILRVISEYFPELFPYHPHWKTTETHPAYWQLTPTIDHIVPIARGGRDEENNWVTTSMLNNSIKSNWTLDELRWKLFAPGNMVSWDGLTSSFIEIVEKDNRLLECEYIKQWYYVSRTVGVYE